MSLSISNWLKTDNNKESISKLIPVSYTDTESVPAKEYIKSLLSWNHDLSSMWVFLEQENIIVIKDNFIKRA